MSDVGRRKTEERGPETQNGKEYGEGEREKLGRERDTEIAYSVNDVPIRLTYERRFHITEHHDDLASYYFEVLEAIEKS